MIAIDKENQILVVRRGSVVTKNLKFDGTIVAGTGCVFLGSLESKFVNLAKNCSVAGVIKAEKVVVGAFSEFNIIEASEVIVLRGCRGKKIISSGDVKIAGNCFIEEVYAENNLLIEGNSKIGKMEAKKIIVVNEL